MELFSIKKVFGYGVYVELLNSSVADSLIEVERTAEHERELWLLGRLHVVISNEMS